VLGHGRTRPRQAPRACALLVTNSPLRCPRTCRGSKAATREENRRRAEVVTPARPRKSKLIGTGGFEPPISCPARSVNGAERFGFIRGSHSTRCFLNTVQSPVTDVYRISTGIVVGFGSSPTRGSTYFHGATISSVRDEDITDRARLEEGAFNRLNGVLLVEGHRPIRLQIRRHRILMVVFHRDFNRRTLTTQSWALGRTSLRRM
jgi:hypothetical protein